MSYNYQKKRARSKIMNFSSIIYEELIVINETSFLDDVLSTDADATQDSEAETASPLQKEQSISTGNSNLLQVIM